jgi:hypothetical protein
LDKELEFRVYDVPDGAGERPECVLGPDEIRAELIWHLDFAENKSKWQVVGRLGKQPFESPEDPYDLDLAEIFGRWQRDEGSADEQWDQRRGRLRVRPKAIDPSERKRFLADRDFRQVSVPNVGRFGPVQVRGIPLGPRDDDDATAWALRLMEDRTDEDGYLPWPEVRQKFGDAVLGTPLEEHRVTLPAADDLLNLRDRSDSRAAYWKLAAVLDLSPVPIPHWLRSELRLDKGRAGAKSSGDREQVVIHMGERLDMQTIAKWLTGGEAPQRVVLCDRFVRGSSNLLALSVFRDAVRCDIEVITMVRDEEMRRDVERACGARVRDYSDVFGDTRRQLHDRYLVVCPTQERPYVWWMSNSILDVRLPDPAEPSTPGLWRELLAVRSHLDDVSSQVAALARGES